MPNRTDIHGYTSASQTGITKPSWLRRRILSSCNIEKTRRILKSLSLNTVCESAKCPNLCECFEKGIATFIIMGDICTRGCRFCAVKRAKPAAVDLNEPARIYEAVLQLCLRYAVITSVTRDDLADGGAFHYGKVVRYLRERLNEIKIEVLVPDFKGSIEALKIVYAAGIDIFAHNLDTPKKFYKYVKPASNYEVSLNVLKKAKMINRNIPVKSGLMLGLGETQEDVFTTMKDLRNAGCDMITIGQYLRPSSDKLKEHEFIPPKMFEKYEEMAYNLDFKSVNSGPFVRSSYFSNKL